MGCESMFIEVSNGLKWEIIHGEFFEIFQELVLYPVLSGLEPGTLCVLGEDHTSVLPNQEASVAKSLMNTQKSYLIY